MSELLADGSFQQRLLGTLGLVASVLVLRALVLRIVRARRLASDAVGLRWHLRVGQAAALALTVGLVFIWAPQLHSLALSAVAIAVAVVIATKEILMCVSGAILRASTDAYTVGDRIEIEGVRGDVIDYGLLSTTVLEIGPAHKRTGRSIVFPNSLLLAQPLVNEAFTKEFVLHTFPVHMKACEDWHAAEAALLAVAHEVGERYRVQTEHQFGRIAREHGLRPGSVEPRVSMRLPDADTVTFLVRVPTAAREKGAVEQEIVRRFLEHRGRRSDGAS